MGEVPQYGGEKKCSVSDNFLSTLDSSVISYIQLSNTGMKAQTNHPGIIRNMDLCLEKGGYIFSCGGALYHSMMSWHADKLVANEENNAVEQRMLE